MKNSRGLTGHTQHLCPCEACRTTRRHVCNFGPNCPAEGIHRTARAIELHLGYMQGRPAPAAQSVSPPKQESDQSLWTGVSDEIAAWLSQLNRRVSEEPSGS